MIILAHEGMLGLRDSQISYTSVFAKKYSMHECFMFRLVQISGIKKVTEFMVIIKLIFTFFDSTMKIAVCRVVLSLHSLLPKQRWSFLFIQDDHCIVARRIFILILFHISFNCLHFKLSALFYGEVKIHGMQKMALLLSS